MVQLEDVSPSRIWAAGMLGSCRIFNPLKLADLAGKLALRRHKGFGYRHMRPSSSPPSARRW